MVNHKDFAAWLTRHQGVVDLAAGAALAVAVSLLLNPDLFGLTKGNVVQVYYGRF